MSDDLIAVGTAARGPLVHVDDAGALRRPDGAVLRWWVLAEDRLHRPEEEAAVRRRLVDHAPVVATALRVPGGDVEGTAYGAVPAGGGPDVAALEVRNGSPVPVVVAVVVEGGGEGWTPGRRPAGSARVADLGAAAARLAHPDRPTDGDGDGPVAVTWIPLPHSQTLRVVWAEGVDPARLPAPDQVVAGWARQVDRGASLSLDDPTLTGRWEVDRRRLVLDDGPRDATALADRLGALLRLGWFDEAVAATEALAAHRRTDGAFEEGRGDRTATTVAALAGLAAWSRAGVPADRLEEIATSVVGAAGWLTRRRRRAQLHRHATAARSALGSAALLLDVAGQPGAAERARHDAAELTAGGAPAVEIAGPAARISRLLDGLVDPGGVAAIEVLRAFTGSWRGRPIEVGGVPTPSGRCSFALRWHGERPALLWEVERWPELDPLPPTLLAPTLDPTWRGGGWNGEALLAPVESGP